MKNHGFWCIGVLAWVFSLTCSFDQTAHADDAYDFSWLDQDKKIYVLQNRRYEKAGRLMLSAMGGLGLSGPYVNVFVFEPRVAFYLSEDFGFEAFYKFYINSRNSTFEALEQASTAIPKIREFKSQLGGVVHWSPWYAKINVFNSILYFDWYFSLGLGTVSSKLDTNTTKGGASTFIDQSFFAVFLGTGHQYHLSQSFVVRLDLLGSFYQAPLLGNSGDNSWFSNYDFTLGVGYRL